MNDTEALTRAAELLTLHADELVDSYMLADDTWPADQDSQDARVDSEEMHALAAHLRGMAEPQAESPDCLSAQEVFDEQPQPRRINITW